MPQTADTPATGGTLATSGKLATVGKLATAGTPAREGTLAKAGILQWQQQSRYTMQHRLRTRQQKADNATFVVQYLSSYRPPLTDNVDE